MANRRNREIGFNQPKWEIYNFTLKIIEPSKTHKKLYRKSLGFRKRRNPRKEETKGLRRMPWCQQAKKDATSCEKPRRAASELRPGGIRMG